MPKLKIVCLLLAAVLAATGTVLVVKNLTGDDIPTFVKPNEDLNTYLDRTDDINIDDETADVRQFLFIAHKLLLSGKGFYGVANGSSTAMGVKQTVRNTRYVVGEFGNKAVLKEMVTKGVVSKAYQLYMQDSNYVYRKSSKISAIDDVTWANSAQALSEEAFYNDFGHRNDKLTGYILNWDTVISGELVEKVDGIYTFRYVLEPDSASTYLRREMIFNGGLNSEPSFSKCAIFVSMDADFNVVSLRTDCEYKAQTMGINATCTEDITEVFIPYDGELPEKDFFEQFFTQTPGGQITPEQTALDALMEMFSPYLNGNDLQVAIDARVSGEKVVSALVSIGGLDISDLSNLTVSARVGNLDLSYVHGTSSIYLKYKDFYASTTVNGIMELVSTLTPLFGGGDALPALDGIDAAALLDNLTYCVEDGKVTVSLPIELGGLTIDAKLYGDVEGEHYVFTNATIKVGDVEIDITPTEWTVESFDGEYPEILGIADIIKNGKLALDAELLVGNYKVNADILVELATGNLQLNAKLGNNGTVSVSLVDGVAYASFGEVKFKLDTANIDGLLDILYQYTGLRLDAATPAMELSASAIINLLSSINTISTANGVDFNLSVAGVDVALHLLNNGGSWQLGGITAALDGFNARITPAGELGEVTVPDAELYVDVTELATTFAEPVMNVIQGVYGVTFNATVTLSGKQYQVVGAVRFDLNNNLKINATVFDGKLGVIDAEVIYANNTVFVTVNGVKVAFDVSGGNDVDVAATLNRLLNNQQIKQLIDSRAELAELVEQATSLVGAVSSFTLSDLLDVDFTQLVTAFSFNNGVLSMSVSGKAFGLNGIALDIELANVDGCLGVTVSGLSVSGVGLDLSATLVNSAETIAVPSTDEYMLNLAGELLGAELQVTLDLVHMDIWASIKYNSDVMLARFVDGKVYVQYAGVALVLNTAELDAVVAKLGKLAGDLPETGSLDVLKVLATLSAMKDKLDVKVNFINSNNKLVFSDISIGFELNGSKQVATIALQAEPAKQLDVTGEYWSGRFVDIIDVICDFADPVANLINAQGYLFDIDATVKLDGRAYRINATVQINNQNLYVLFSLSYQNTRMIEGELWFVDNVLYLDAGDLRLAVPLNQGNGGSNGTKTLADTLDSIKGYNGYVDQIVELVERIVNTSIADVDFQQLLSSLSYNNGVISLEVNGKQFGVSNFTLGLAASDGITLSVSNLSYGSIAISVNSAYVCANNDVILAPRGDFTTNFKVVIDEANSLYVNVNLYDKVIKMKLLSYTTKGKATSLDLMYSLTDNVLKITDGKELYVSVDITSISNIVKEINRIVNEFAGADAELPLPGLGEANNIDLKDILNSLTITNSGSSVKVGLTALGLKLTATFSGGRLSNVSLPLTDDIKLKIEPTSDGVIYRDFPQEEEGYVRIDQVFNDYYFGGDGETSGNNGPIYDLITTNSWKFAFNKNSIISVKDDDGTTTHYQIEKGSFVVFYYNKTEPQKTKLRAKLTVNKSTDGTNWEEFIILDAAYIDGRVYISYDSNTKDTSSTVLGKTTYSNSNVLRATLSVAELQKTLALKDELIRVLQLETLIQQLESSLAQAQGSISLGNLASMFKSVGYENSTFTMSLNSGIIDGLGEVELSVHGEGSTLTLNQLTLSYDNFAINLEGIEVSASGMEEDGEFTYVKQDILGYFKDNAAGDKDKGKSAATSSYDPTNDHGYDMSNHMNFDSLYELVSALLRTAGATDNAGQRSFWVYNEKGINVKLTIIGLDMINLTIPVSLYADIDADGNSFFALKLIRSDTKALGSHVYDDLGGNSYLLFDSKSGLFTIMRDSYRDDIKLTSTYEEDENYGWCTVCEKEVSKVLGSYFCNGGSGFTNKHKSNIEERTRTVTKTKTETKTGYESQWLGEPQYIRENLTASDLFANIGTTDGECPLFELLNLGTISLGLIKFDLENTIREQIGQPNDNVYGVEDVFKGYEYSANDMQFKITADLSPISSALGTFVLTIDHDEDYFLNHLGGDLDIASVISISIDLDHTTPGFGYAQHFFAADGKGGFTHDYTRLWNEWGGTGVSYNFN